MKEAEWGSNRIVSRILGSGVGGASRFFGKRFADEVAGKFSAATDEITNPLS